MYVYMNIVFEIRFLDGEKSNLQLPPHSDRSDGVRALLPRRRSQDRAAVPSRAQPATPHNLPCVCGVAGDHHCQLI